MADPTPGAAPRRFQLHLTLPYKFEPRRDPRVRRWLDRGYRVEQLQRLTDREAILTLAKPDGAPAPA